MGYGNKRYGIRRDRDRNTFNHYQVPGYRSEGRDCTILRAGLGMVDGILSLIPTAKVGHVGL